MKRKSIRAVRVLLMGLIIAVGSSVLPHVVVAEDLPTSGTFKGYYHRYRTGQALFLFFVVPEKLQPQFASHDGKYIQVEVLKANQPKNPGPAYIEKLGKITVLPQPPVKIHIELHPPVAGAAFTVDVFTLIENIGKEPLTLSRGPQISGPPGSGGPAIGAYLCNSSGGKTTLASGQKLPAVALGWKGGPGPSEIEMDEITPMGPAKAWINVDFDKSGTFTPLTRPDSQIRVTGKVVRQEQEEMHLVAQIANHGDARRTVYVAQRRTSGWQYPGTVLDKDGLWLKGRVQAFDDQGNSIAITVGPYWNEGGWTKQEIPEKGIELTFRLHHNDLFSNRPIRTIAIYLLTDRGLERFDILVKEDLTVAALPKPEPRTHGQSIRIRTSKPAFGRGEPMRLFVQGVDPMAVGEKPFEYKDAFYVTPEQLPKAIRVLIDGKTLTANADPQGSGFEFPFEAVVIFKPPDDLSVGTHTVEVIINDKRGKICNARSSFEIR